jgi:hypothetical protein
LLHIDILVNFKTLKPGWQSGDASACRKLSWKNFIKERAVSGLGGFDSLTWLSLFSLNAKSVGNKMKKDE